MRIKAVLFDLDDTLWPVAPVIQHAESTLHAWMTIHVPSVPERFSIEQLRQHRNALVASDPRFRYDLWSLRHTLLSKIFEQVGEDPELANTAMEIFSNARNEVALYEDVLPALAQLGGRFVLGTVSNGFADLQKIGLSPHFAVSLAAHSFGCAKPDPRIFLAACDALELAPEQVAYVGDDLALDVQGAQDVGMKGIWMNRHGIELRDTPHRQVRPDAIAQNLHEVVNYLSLFIQK